MNLKRSITFLGLNCVIAFSRVEASVKDDLEQFFVSHGQNVNVTLIAAKWAVILRE